MSKKDEALKLALEALEESHPEAYRHIITAIREALADSALERMAENARELGLGYEPAQQQEPFGYFRYDLRLDAWVQNREGRPGIPLYTSPQPSKPWVGLTNQELIDLTSAHSGAALYCAIEAKLKEKNHG